MNRWNNLKKLLRMEGSVVGNITTGAVIVSGFIVGLYVGRFLLELI